MSDRERDAGRIEEKDEGFQNAPPPPTGRPEDLWSGRGPILLRYGVT